MPFVRVNGIVIYSEWCAKGRPTVRAAREHHISAVVSREWLHASHDINVIVSRSARSIHRDERLATEPNSIDAALNKVATQVDLSGLVKRRRHSRVLCIG